MYGVRKTCGELGIRVLGRIVERYILWVTVKEVGGGYSSWQYGWSNRETYSYVEAVAKKKELRGSYYEIEIVEEWGSRGEIK